MDTPQGIPNQSPEPDNSGVGNGTIGTGGVPQTGKWNLLEQLIQLDKTTKLNKQENNYANGKRNLWK